MPQAKAKAKKRTSSSASRAKTSAKRSRAKTSSNGSRAKTSAKRSNNRSTSRAPTRDSSIAQKAKAPALAAGAMLLGLAGGATVARNTKRRGPRLPKPKLSVPALNLKRVPRPKSVSLPTSGGSTAAWVGEKAKALADAGNRVADLTSEVAKVEKTLKKG